MYLELGRHFRAIVNVDADKSDLARSRNSLTENRVDQTTGSTPTGW